MEAAALLAVAGLGYIVTQLSGKKNTEQFKNPDPSGLNWNLDKLDYQSQTLLSGPPPPSEPKPEKIVDS